MPLLALEVLHVMALNKEARRAAGFLESGVIEAVCAALSNSATDNPKKPSDGRADVTFWGLEILHLFLTDLERGAGIQAVIQDPMTNTFLETLSRTPGLIKALCATLLTSTKMRFPRYDDETGEGDSFDIPRSYGPAVVLVKESCAGFKDTHGAAMGLLFSITAYTCATESSESDAVWDAVLFRSDTPTQGDEADGRRLGATLAAHYLCLLLEDKNSPFLLPTGKTMPRQLEEFKSISRPLVRHQLLEGLKYHLMADASDPYMASMLVAFQVPRICLSIWQDPALVDLAFELIRLMVDSHEEDLIHIFVESKPTLLSLFDMLNAESSVEIPAEQVGEIRKVVANILGSLAESGLLTTSVERFGVKSSAVSALAAACLADEVRGDDDDDDELATSATMSSRCMACLVELCTVEKKGKKTMQLGPDESVAIAKRLGKKICQMVISRFIERAKLRQYDVDEDDNVMDAPDVKLLCAIAQHGNALKVIASIGGLHALSLVAAEGELSAVLALKKACEDDPATLISVDGHVSVMKLISEDEPVVWPSEEAKRTIETAVFELLSDLCSKSKTKRAVVAANECSDCIAHAAHVVASLVEKVPIGGAPVGLSGLSGLAGLSGLPPPMVPSAPPPPSGEDDEIAADNEVYANTHEEDEAEAEAVADPDSEENTDEEEDDGADGPGEQSKQDSSETAAPSVQYEYRAKPQFFALGLESSALAFLAKIVGVQQCRMQLFSHEDFMPAMKALARESTSFKLQLQTTTFLSNVSPFAKSSDDEGRTLSTTDLADAFTGVLKIKPPSPSSKEITEKENFNVLKTVAAKGLGIILNDTTVDLQVSAMEAVAAAWNMVVRQQTVARTAGNSKEKANSGLLAYNLSSLMVRSTSNIGLLSCLSQADLLKCMIHLVEWRYDTKTTLKGNDQQLYWDGATSNAVQHLSYIICGIEERHVSLGVSTKTLAGTVLMLARPGKAPRKTADFPTTLQRVMETRMDAASVLAAERILQRIMD